MAIVKDVELRWVNHITPDTYGNLTMDIMLSSEQEMDLVDLGLNLKTDKDNRVYYRFSYQPVDRKGNTITIPVRDRFGTPITEKIPNGTRADVEFYTYTWEFNKKTGVKARVVMVKVLNDLDANTSIQFDKRDNLDED